MCPESSHLIPEVVRGARDVAQQLRELHAEVAERRMRYRHRVEEAEEDDVAGVLQRERVAHAYLCCTRAALQCPRSISTTQ